ncbi:uncharacterized protein BXZ73DRAFT_101564 [Epithele typhae]|uniref:uncharacterized protein n=1 Tax=Epithele typhae TaxID=378194 RepID=UPI00200800C4|nr:uncharacterized protein BXZ73DRAFT_101564 [Epithele typhae]KAH9931653.1 hypothetical protein BXZ73DRAFT_101564 [Epithele typhae]
MSSEVSSFFTQTGIAPTSVATGTAAVASSMSTPFAESGSSDAGPSVASFSDATGLDTDLRAVQFVSVLASLTFGIAVTKAWAYFRSRGGYSAAKKGTIASLVIVNLIQWIASVYGAYHSVTSITNDNSDEWAIMVQIGLATLAAVIAQSYFAVQLYASKRNSSLFMTILFFALLQLVLSWVAVGIMFTQGFIETSTWDQIMTLGITCGVDLVIAVLTYVWLERPLYLQQRGATRFLNEATFWSFGGLFGCSLVALFAAVCDSIAARSLVWLVAVSALGNLHTISVLSSLDVRAPMVVTTAAPAPASTSTRSSVATLTADDASFRKDLEKAQLAKATEASLDRDPETEVPPPPRYVPQEKSAFDLGYLAGGAPAVSLRPFRTSTGACALTSVTILMQV